jgi:hypothetical protein
VRKRIGFTLLFSVLLSSVWAQLTESDTLRFGYRANVNGSWITGNVERLLISTNADLSHVGKSIGFKSSNSYLYGTIYKKETENDIFSRNFFYLHPRKRFYPYGMVWLQNSTRQQIDLRYQVGLGVTYGLVNTESNQLKISTTLTYEKTHYNGTNFFIEPKDVDSNTVTNQRVTIRLLGNHMLIKRKFKLKYETWYQPAFNDVNNWRYYLNTSLEFPVSKHFSFRTALLYTHDNMVLAGVKRDDKIMTFGVNISNY